MKNVSDVVTSDQWQSLNEINETVHISHGTAFNIVSKDLNMNKSVQDGFCGFWQMETNWKVFRIPGNF